MRRDSCRKILPLAASIAGRNRLARIRNTLYSFGFSAWHVACSTTDKPQTCGICQGSFMLLALGAASAALNAIKSLTAPKPTASQPIGTGPVGATWSDDSTAPAGGSAGATTYSSGPQISPDNLSTLLAVQSQSTGFGSEGTAVNSLPLPTTPSSTASSAYTATDQLIQRQSSPALLPTPPISLSA
jgi:hypothetical protein